MRLILWLAADECDDLFTLYCRRPPSTEPRLNCERLRFERKIARIECAIASVRHSHFLKIFRACRRLQDAMIHSNLSLIFVQQQEFRRNVIFNLYLKNLFPQKKSWRLLIQTKVLFTSIITIIDDQVCGTCACDNLHNIHFIPPKSSTHHCQEIVDAKLATRCGCDEEEDENSVAMKTDSRRVLAPSVEVIIRVSLFLAGGNAEKIPEAT